MGTADEPVERIAATWRVDAAAEERRHRRTLHEHDAQSATFEGVAADLIERGSVVTLLAGGLRYTGRLVGLGDDFVAIDHAGGTTYVVLDAITGLLVSEEPHRTPSDRTVRGPVSLAELLAELATEQPRVQVRDRDGSRLAGRMLDVGSDVMRLRLDGDGGLAYVALWSLADASVTGSG